MSTQHRAQFPAWLSVTVNIFIAAVLVLSFLFLYAKGNFLAWTRAGTPDWPSKDPILETILTGVGGIMAAVFAVALNLPRSPVPRSFSALTNNLGYVLNLVPSSPGGSDRKVSSDLRKRMEQARLDKGQAAGSVGRGGDAPAAAFGTPINWEDLNQTALISFGSILVLAYPAITIASVVTKLGFAGNAPKFVLNFAGGGAGVLLGAFAVWMSQIARGPR